MTTSSVNEKEQQPSSSSAATAGGDTANCDYVNIDELLQDMKSNDGDGDCDKQGDLLGGAKMQRFLRTLLTVWAKTIFCLGIRSESRSRRQLIPCIRTVRSNGRHCILTSN